MESYCLIGRVLVLQMKKFWRWMMVVLQDNVKVLDATEPYA